MTRRRSRRGSQAVEAALVLPVFIALLSAVIDYGWFFVRQQGMVNAAREGARSGAIVPLAAGPQYEAVAVTKDRLYDAGLAADLSTLDATLSGASPDILLTVVVELNNAPVLGLLPTPRTMETRVTTRLEDQGA